MSASSDDTPLFDDPEPTGDDPYLPAVPGYELLEEVAVAGLATFYRARDLNTHQEVAIKVLLLSNGNQDYLRSEAQNTSLLQHPGIVPIHALGQLPDGRPFLVLKLIRGWTLSAVLRDRASPSDGLPRLLSVFEQVCRTVAYAHSRGVIHRNLKPSKVMIGTFGEVYVVGWGVARLTDGASPPGSSSGESLSDRNCVGTPVYMPPEQVRGEVADTRSDVFGLGGVLCAILTGQPPYSFSAVTMHLLEPAATGDVAEAFARLDACGADPELIALAKRCLSPDRADRPPDAAAVASMVAAYRTATGNRRCDPEGKRDRV